MAVRAATILLPFLLVSAGEDGDPPRPVPPVPPAAAANLPATATRSAAPFAALTAALPYVAVGARYRVQSDVSREVADECLVVLEAAWPLFAERFVREARPRGGASHLPIHVYRTRDVYRAHQSAGMEPWTAQAAGFYDRVHGVGHLEWSPLAYSQRRLLLHEAAHQFHYLSLGAGRRDIFPRWYVEGVANDLDRHRYVDRRLELAVDDVPFTLGHEDLAVQHIRSPSFDLARLLEGGAMTWIEGERDRKAVGHVIVRFFRGHREDAVRGWFRQFETAVSRGRPPLPWSDDLPSQARLREDLARLAAELVPARTAPQSEWQRLGSEVRACVLTGGSSCWPCLAGPVPGGTTSLRFDVGHALHPSDGIGFVLGFVDAGNFSVAVFKDRLKRLLVTTRRDGRWTEEHLVDVRPPESAHGVTLELESEADGQFRVGLDGQVLFSGSLPGPLRAGGTGFWGEASDAPGQNPGSRLFRFQQVRSAEEVRAR